MTNNSFKNFCKQVKTEVNSFILLATLSSDFEYEVLTTNSKYQDINIIKKEPVGKNAKMNRYFSIRIEGYKKIIVDSSQMTDWVVLDKKKKELRDNDVNYEWNKKYPLRFMLSSKEDAIELLNELIL